jgi:hypothetical protein
MHDQLQTSLCRGCALGLGHITRHGPSRRLFAPDNVEEPEPTFRKFAEGCRRHIVLSSSFFVDMPLLQNRGKYDNPLTIEMPANSSSSANETGLSPTVLEGFIEASLSSATNQWQ